MKLARTQACKGLMRHANISTTMNTSGRAAIKAKQEANIKSGADDPAQKGSLRLVWVLWG
jgi:hypothetical protein